MYLFHSDYVHNHASLGKEKACIHEQNGKVYMRTDLEHLGKTPLDLHKF
jgi:hypothetical protein